MPFNLLVTTCACKEQKWRYKPKEGAHIYIDALENEHVIFFEIDEKTNGTSQFRKHFEMDKDNEKICDLLIYYFTESKNFNIKRDYKIICLAESKSKMSDDAIEQIKNTFSHLNNNFSKDSDSKAQCYNKPIIWCAYVATTSFGAGQNLRRKEYRKALKNIAGIKYSDVSEVENIGEFLRNCSIKLENEKKR